MNHFYVNPNEISTEIDISLTETSFNISCPSNKARSCVDQLTQISWMVANLNKYFWIPSYYRNKLVPIFANKNLPKLPIISAICSVNLFHDLVSFWIFQDIRKPTHFPNCFQFRSLHDMDNLLGFSDDSFLLYKVEKYSFLSCYNVQRDSSLLSALTSPFDFSAWLCFLASLLLVAILLTTSQNKFSSDGAQLAVGVMLESSVLSLLKFPKKYHISLVVIFWTLFGGTVLPNLYKTVFTIEMIFPTRYTAPWEGLLDIDGVKALMPLRLMTANIRSLYPYDVYANLFYLAIRQKALSLLEVNKHNKRYKNYRRMANLLLNSTLKNFTLHGPTLNHTQRRYIPIQPILYNETAQLIEQLSPWDKIGFLDEKENVEAILPFLNDNKDGITYLMGEDAFFTGFRGWPVLPIRRDYSLRRLGVMLSSGIYDHWEGLFKLVKPKKLFHHYANWTFPRLRRVAKLDFKSKIMTAFYICGGCLLGSVMFLVGEVISVFFLYKKRPF